MSLGCRSNNEHKWECRLSYFCQEDEAAHLGLRALVTQLRTNEPLQSKSIVEALVDNCAT